MKRLIDQPLIELSGRALPINAGGGLRCYVEILEAIQEELDAMLARHSRILVLRMDLRAREYSEDNKPLSDLMRKLKRALQRRYGQDIGYVWAREQETAKQQHWHLLLMLNGNRVRHPAQVIKLIEKMADVRDWPKPWTPDHPYYLVRRDDLAIYRDAFYRASYLAKERGKGYKHLTANDFNRSRIGRTPTKLPKPSCQSIKPPNHGLKHAINKQEKR